ncbi:MAG TPA: DUF6498-containing protein [Verrucomicrobiae bacterium]|nr:DUF6498-containing protein [Verrucomicrobiae bacterium]
MVQLQALRQISRDDWLRPSVIALLAANLVPIFGVLLLKWDVFSLMFLFWVENVVIGLFNVLRMAVVPPTPGFPRATKLFLIPFFCFHFGMFTLVHGIFVLALFGEEPGGGMSSPNPMLFLNVIREYHLFWAVVGLVASHGVSFVSNFLRGGEYKRADLGRLMAQPYARIFVLHVTILGGGLLMAALKEPFAGLIVLIVLKIMIDLASHLAERKKFESDPATAASRH